MFLHFTLFVLLTRMATAYCFACQHRHLRQPTCFVDNAPKIETSWDLPWIEFASGHSLIEEAIDTGACVLLPDTMSSLVTFPCTLNTGSKVYPFRLRYKMAEKALRSAEAVCQTELTTRRNSSNSTPPLGHVGSPSSSLQRMPTGEDMRDSGSCGYGLPLQFPQEASPLFRTPETCTP